MLKRSESLQELADDCWDQCDGLKGQEWQITALRATVLHGFAEIAGLLEELLDREKR